MSFYVYAHKMTQWLYSYCLHHSFISQVNAVNTKGNTYIKGCSGLILTGYMVYLFLLLMQSTWRKTHTHNFAHNFLNIQQPFFNLIKDLESWDSGMCMVCILKQLKQAIRISNAFSAMYVNSNTKYSNYMKLWLKALNQNKIQNTTLN